MPPLASLPSPMSPSPHPTTPPLTPPPPASSIPVPPMTSPPPSQRPAPPRPPHRASTPDGHHSHGATRPSNLDQSQPTSTDLDRSRPISAESRSNLIASYRRPWGARVRKARVWVSGTAHAGDRTSGRYTRDTREIHARCKRGRAARVNPAAIQQPHSDPARASRYGTRTQSERGVHGAI